MVSSLRLSFAPVMMIAAMLASPALGQDAGEATSDSVTPEQILAGSNLFNGGTCVFCHAIAGRGSGTRAPDLSDVEWLHSQGDLDGILQTIISGVPQPNMKAVKPRPFPMNPKGGLNVSDEQLASVAAYVWALSQPEPHGFITEQWRFLELARAGQFAEARAVFQATREKYPDNLLVPENGMNAFGYEFLGRDDLDGAIEVFQFNVDLHPEAFNPWDSLAEAYMAKGDNEHAIEYYEKSLELNPENTNAVDKLKELGAR